MIIGISAYTGKLVDHYERQKSDEEQKSCAVLLINIYNYENNCLDKQEIIKFGNLRNWT